MPRYRTNARFGAWSIGEEFESIDPYHEALAEGGLLSVVGAPAAEAEAPFTPPLAGPEASEPEPVLQESDTPDTTSGEESA